jgi:hypothetical protein
MLVHLSCFPPGSGESEYTLAFDMPALPRERDYISVVRPDQIGSEDFIVRRVNWVLEFPKTAPTGSGDGPTGKILNVYIEGEFAESAFSSAEHKRALEGFAAGGRQRLRHKP